MSGQRQLKWYQKFWGHRKISPLAQTILNELSISNSKNWERNGLKWSYLWLTNRCKKYTLNISSNNIVNLEILSENPFSDYEQDLIKKMMYQMNDELSRLKKEERIKQDNIKLKSLFPNVII
jgi:hypothetical protein